MDGLVEGEELIIRVEPDESKRDLSMDRVVEKPQPLSVRKMKDKYGNHRVFSYDGLEMLEYILYERVQKQKKHQDSVYLVSGLEGSGKSMLTLWGADIYQDLTGQEIPIKHVTRSLREMFGLIYDLKERPSYLTLDEGSELDGTNTMTKEVKKTKKKFTVMRKCSHIIMIVFINPLRITTYFREDRVRGLFFVKEPGVVWFYSNNQNNPHLAEIIDTWSKEHEAKSLKFLLNYAPDMILRGVPDYHGRLRNEYESRKDDNIFDILKEDSQQAEAEVGSLAEYVDLRQAEKMFGMTNKALRQSIARGLLNSIKIRNRLHINKIELSNYVNNRWQKTQEI